MAVAKGKNIVLLIRDLSQPKTEADYILYQTDFSKTISKEIDETVTKTGTIKATSDSSTEISVTALAQEDDAVLDTLEERNPWITELRDKINSDDTIKAKFYTNYRKDFLSMWIQT